MEEIQVNDKRGKRNRDVVIKQLSMNQLVNIAGGGGCERVYLPPSPPPFYSWLIFEYLTLFLVISRLYYQHIVQALLSQNCLKLTSVYLDFLTTNFLFLVGTLGFTEK